MNECGGGRGWNAYKDQTVVLVLCFERSNDEMVWNRVTDVVYTSTHNVKNKLANKRERFECDDGNEWCVEDKV